MAHKDSSGVHILTSDAARILEVTESAVRAAVAQGRLSPRHRTPGGVAIFHRADIEVRKQAIDAYRAACPRLRMALGLAGALPLEPEPEQLSLEIR